MPSAFGVPTASTNRYQAPPTRILLATLTAKSSATLTFTGLDPLVYQTYRFVGQGLSSATAPVTCTVACSSDKGATFAMTGEGTTFGGLSTANSWQATEDSTSPFNIMHNSNGAAMCFDAALYIYIKDNTDARSTLLGYSAVQDNNINRCQPGTFAFKFATTVSSYPTDIRFALSAGTFRQGTIKVYGES